MANEYKRSILQETVKEGLNDPYKLVGSVICDVFGASSALAYGAGFIPGLVGDLTDLGTSVGQTSWINLAYRKDLTTAQKIGLSVLSMGEELGPGPTDLVPSATIAHFAAAYNRAKKNLAAYKEQKAKYKL